MKAKVSEVVKVIDLSDDVLKDMIKTRIRSYRRGLVSLDDLFGYLYAFEDLGVISSRQFTAMVKYIIDHDDCCEPIQ